VLCVDGVRVVGRTLLLHRVHVEPFGDREHPGAEAETRIEAVEVLQDAYERLLDDVLRQVRAAGHTQDEGVEGLLVGPDQGLDRLAVASLGAADELSFDRSLDHHRRCWPRR